MAKHRRMPHEPLAGDVRASPKAEVSKRMASLHGQSRAELERDDIRGASSPLGGGSLSRPTVRRKGRG
jgi:hypothetical protein